MLTVEEKYKICELFKAHYTAAEVSSIMCLNYQTIAVYFSAFRKLDVQKYDRTILLGEDFDDEKTCNG